MSRRDAAGRAAVAGLGAWAVFAVVGVVAAGGGGAPLPVDRGLLAWSLGHRPEVALAVARGLTATGTGAVPYALVVLAGVLLGRTPRLRALAAGLGVVCLAVGQMARYGLMELATRPRPPRLDWATAASGWSFPSGHTTTSALTAGLLIAATLLRGPRGRTALCVVAGCWGALVGLTRVYLGVHWFTDVIGGWLYAAGWLAVCLYAAVRWLPSDVLDGLSEAGATAGEPPGGAERSYSGRRERPPA
ncbi:phosphatase PAP2 family protein [Streptomyces sp. NPDC085995]|uniref:phosphatase PAP2 family protein n=1 Tax=Streptomyces sp. NPDC085995 TaxID=3154861 RepID=UPI003421A10B